MYFFCLAASLPPSASPFPFPFIPVPPSSPPPRPLLHPPPGLSVVYFIRLAAFLRSAGPLVVYFIRLAAYLRSLGPLVLWIVIEAPLKTEETAELLKQHAGSCLPAGDASCRRINYVHLETRRVETSKWNKAVLQRNTALDFIQERRIQGVVYFMDDDNAYLPQLFLEFQSIKNVGVFPVGFLYPDEYSRRNRHIHHTPMVERPLVKRTESGGLQVYGWETFEWFISKARRKFNVDMGGFAFR
ncbi:unnamed protein product [Closterium sp. NIES-65]|nr:unnamed protein product [Closterium sp. NIES-65]